MLKIRGAYWKCNDCDDHIENNKATLFLILESLRNILNQCENLEKTDDFYNKETTQVKLETLETKLNIIESVEHKETKEDDDEG